MSEEEALVRSILREPEDDTVRLAYADWLDENVKETTCPDCLGHRGRARFETTAFRYGTTAIPMTCDDFNKACAKPDVIKAWRNKCYRCDGRGHVPGGGTERAEFIRVQIEIARRRARPHFCFHPDAASKPLQDCGCDDCSLGRRERDLFCVNMHTWFPGFDYVEVDGPSSMRQTYVTSAVIRRGFVDDVQLPLHVFYGAVDWYCGAHDRRFAMDPSYVNPGRACTTCHNSTCVDPHRAVRFDGIAADLFAHHPITSVTLTDRTPQLAESTCWWSSPNTSDYNFGYGLPVPIWNALSAYDRVQHNWALDFKDGLISVKFYSSNQTAVRDLNKACVLYGRKLAGLTEETG